MNIISKWLSMLRPQPKPQEKSRVNVVPIDSIEDLEQLFGDIVRKGPKQAMRCPEIMKATSACFCMECKLAKAGTCSAERMAKESGCTNGFPIYCTLRDEGKVTQERTLCDILLKEWYQKIEHKFDVQLTDKAKPMSTIKEIEEEVKHGKEKERGIRTESTGDSECPEESL